MMFKDDLASQGGLASEGNRCKHFCERTAASASFVNDSLLLPSFLIFLLAVSLHATD